MLGAKRKHAALVLRLYVAGNAPNSARAIANIRAICAEHFPKSHDLEIVDLLKEPMRAIPEKIIVTPTLITLAPPPARRLIGDLSDTRQVLLALLGK